MNRRKGQAKLTKRSIISTAFRDVVHPANRIGFLGRGLTGLACFAIRATSVLNHGRYDGPGFGESGPDLATLGQEPMHDRTQGEVPLS